MSNIRRGKIGVYGAKTRNLQKRFSAQLFGLTFKEANVYLYLGSRENADPSINDIQNPVFFEVPDRAYAETPVNISLGMEQFVEQAMDFSRFGIINPLSDEQTFRVHVDEMKCLGRTMIVGDVFEVPFFQSPDEDCAKIFWEVTDVDSRVSHEKFYVVVKATIMNDSRKTREVPVGVSNDDFLEGMMDSHDESWDEQVPHQGFEDDGQDVDYRNPLQRGFLDDPSKVFNED